MKTARQAWFGITALLIVAGGCRTGGGWTPSDGMSFERMPVEAVGRWGSVRELRFGEYTADSVHVSWARGSGNGAQPGNVGAERRSSEQAYRFTLQPNDGTRLSTTCRSGASERNVALGGFELEVSMRLSLDCELRRAGDESPWRLTLRAGADGAFEGTLLRGDTRLRVIAETAGNRVVGKRPGRYDVHDDAGLVAAVDPQKRVVWFARHFTDAERRHLAAAVSAALLLYRSPAGD